MLTQNSMSAKDKVKTETFTSMGYDWSQTFGWKCFRKKEYNLMGEIPNEDEREKAHKDTLVEEAKQESEKQREKVN